ncbi:hypothetical protein B0E33_04110 [Roseibium algicola]|uniref:DUF11 domain-containing protein n=1 Tax=Roseibium algicola TaxID=2857014 RepID=A0ABM6HXT1_9HYPH|nr:DUF11 domain-containing protein [Roseibium aggregatum]AQQ02876.1 hypothetical protein B0E33_04110 [Roseibium aggregatum]
MTAQLHEPLSPVTDSGPDRLFLVNRATATLDEPDPTPDNNTDTATIIPFVDGRSPAPDLVVTKTNDIVVIGGSETVSFTITAENVGTRVAAEVQVIDRIDTNVFEFVSASDGGSYDAASGTVAWRFNTLSPDDGLQTFTMVLKVKAGLASSNTTTTNVVEIEDNGLGGTDPTPDNNRDTHTDRLIYPDLLVTKTNNVEEVSPGDIVDYQITVSNVGAFKADGVNVVDLADPRIYRFVSASGGGVYDAATGRINWTLGTVEAGSAPQVLTLRLEVLFPSSADIENAVNVVTVTSDGTRGLDSNPLNNFAFDIDILNAAPDPLEIDRVLADPEEEDEEEKEDLLYISPILTGTAAPGATVSVILCGPGGGPIQLAAVHTAMDGSWLMTLANVAGRGPVSAIVVTSPPMLTGLGTLDATNVFLNPGGDTPIAFERHYDIFNAEDASSATVLASQTDASEDPYSVSSRRYVNFNDVAGTGLTGG